MNLLSVMPLVMAGVSLYIGFVHIAVNYFRLRRPVDLSFGITCLFMAVYNLLCAGLYSAGSVEQGVMWQRSQLVALSFNSVSFLFFIVHYSGYRKPGFIAGYSIGNLVCGIIGMFNRSDLTWKLDHPLIKHLEIMGHRFTIYEVEPGFIPQVQSFLALLLFAYVIRAAVVLNKKGNRETAFLFVCSTMLYFAGSINDTFVFSGVYSFIYLLEYSFIAIIILMTYKQAATIVDKARLQEVLKESEERFRSVVELSPFPICVFNEKGVVEYLNPAFVDLFKYSIDDVPDVEAWFFRAFPDEKLRTSIREFWNSDLQRVILGQKVSPAVIEVICNDGELVRVRGHLVRSSRERFYVVFENITRESRLQQQLIRARKMEAIGRLAAGIAHDFNNMLSGIIGFSEILKSRLSGREEEKYADKIMATGERAVKLIDKLNAYAGQRELEFEQTDLHELLQAVIASFQKQNDIEIDFVPEAENPRVLCDTGLLGSALENMLSNAHDAIPGSGKVSVSTGNAEFSVADCESMSVSIEPGKYLEINISDTGQGMDEEILDSIFEPFFSTKDRPAGKGLGLALAYSAIKDHNGFISVFSKPEEGSLFTVYLPLS